MKHENNLIWFDLFRGIAALLVVTGHLRSLMFEDFSSSHNVFSLLFYSVTGFAHEAVVIFFVLSGFFIIRSIHESTLRNKWDPKEYALNRLTRLWVVLIPSLLATLVLDKIGLHYFENSFTYTGAIKTMQAVSPLNRSGVMDFIGNVFFVQSIFVPTFGSNSALWSLANEFWYYALFPLIYFSLIKYYRVPVRIVSAVIFLACLFFVGQGIVLPFIIWLMGGASYLIIKNNLFLKRWIAVKAVLLVFIFISILILIKSKIYTGIFNDFSLGLVTSLMLCVFSKVPMKNNYFRRLTEFLSNISYTVYLSHLSFAVLLVSVFLTNKIPFIFSNFMLYLLLLFITLVYSCLFYYFFERKTQSVKEFIKRRL